MIEIGGRPILWHIMKTYSHYGFNDFIISKRDGLWVNTGFFVLQPEIFDYIEGDHKSLEKEPLETLAKQGQVMTFKHRGF